MKILPFKRRIMASAPKLFVLAPVRLKSGECSLAESLPTRPAVGIWWANSETIVAVWQDAERSMRQAGLRDSQLEHWRVWPHVASLFGRGKDSDYFAVPRGRVLLDLKSDDGLIYYGNETGEATLVRIASAFCLIHSRFQLDEHYLMGSRVDDLFEDY